MLDYFPILRILPDFMNPEKRKWKQLHNEEITLYKDYMLKVKERINKGILTGCFCEDMFKMQEKDGFSDDWASYVSGTLLEAGSDTTASIFLLFAVVMVNFPEAQKHRQKLIESLVPIACQPWPMSRTSNTFGAW
ncbi:hypothetical protein VTN77DRAFT_229 [Rasamsonia byssochlamydoides]|uniref:uncharacterized protein n=1 Tax=Rasamsonia byssochlamydoides TaxID=89139 RepID=UPI003743EFC4